MPAPWQEQLSGSFQQLLLIHIVRQECFVPAAQHYVGQHFGKGFTEPEPWTLDQVFEESSAGTPIIFILSTGVAVNVHTALIMFHPHQTACTRGQDAAQEPGV